jgi:hypothetical protein
LGCRAGWGKDHWVSATASGADLTTAISDDDNVSTQPIPHVAAEAATGTVAQAAVPGVAATGSNLTRGRRVGQAPIVSPLGGISEEPDAAKDAGVKRTTSLENHPELNEQGIPYRNSTKRSSVAEAHRRALARREKERVAKDERDQTRLIDVATPTAPSAPAEHVAATPPSVPTPPLSPANRPPIAPPSRVPLRPITSKPEGEMLDLPRRGSIPLPATPPRAPMMPAPRPEVEPEPEVVEAQDEAIDRVIPNVAPPAAIEPARESNATIPTAPSEPTPAPHDEPVSLPDVHAEARSTPAERQTIVTQAPEVPVEEKGNQKPYWHERLNNSPYQRMSLPPREPQRPVNPVGRPRPETPAMPRTTPGRRIRTLDEVKNGLPMIESPAPPVEEQQPTRAQMSAPITPPPAAPVPEVAPRQIDEALLRQLETNWRTQALAAHTGQRCGNCRFFRPTDGGQGSCGCSFSNAYSRPVEPQGLECLDGLGTWWSAADDGWLERTERRPRRATPLLDALLREREEELARSMPERRRAR